jgi:hypothetical protein
MEVISADLGRPSPMDNPPEVVAQFRDTVMAP